MVVEQLVLIVHVLIAFAMIGLILLQQGKGADMGASFGGGGSQTLFGPGGGGNALTRATAVLAALFFVTSFGLAIIAKQKTAIDPTATGLGAVAEQLETESAEQATLDAALSEIPESLPDVDLLPVTTDTPENDLPGSGSVGDLPAGDLPQ